MQKQVETVEDIRINPYSHIFCEYNCDKGFLLGKIISDDKTLVLPKNSSHSMQMLQCQNDMSKEIVINDITKRMLQSKIFSISLEEYAYWNECRYLNVNVHPSDKFSD
ncbi:Hypothetical predicted protein [Octopus vulgaris]|uniref:Uncharacterized protein n=1 Tax=Octopus vulgaris TaxID=6645 RepID=A0AA36ARV9_OCTVU|nr:Hypothetical predicted protein [Octopus vulgaris]